MEERKQQKIIKEKRLSLTATLEELALIRNMLLEHDSTKAAMLVEEGKQKLRLVHGIENMLIKYSPQEEQKDIQEPETPIKNEINEEDEYEEPFDDEISP